MDFLWWGPCVLPLRGDKPGSWKSETGSWLGSWKLEAEELEVTTSTPNVLTRKPIWSLILYLNCRFFFYTELTVDHRGWKWEVGSWSPRLEVGGWKSEDWNVEVGSWMLGVELEVCYKSFLQIRRYYWEAVLYSMKGHLFAWRIHIGEPRWAVSSEYSQGTFWNWRLV